MSFDRSGHGKYVRGASGILDEVEGLGLLDITRYPKRHVCAMSQRWGDIETRQQAMIVSARARVQRMPPVTPPQPATAHAQA